MQRYYAVMPKSSALYTDNKYVWMLALLSVIAEISLCLFILLMPTIRAGVHDYMRESTRPYMRMLDDNKLKTLAEW